MHPDAVKDQTVSLQEWYGINEVAARFGVAPSTVRGWRRNGKGPQSYIIMGSVKFHRDDLDAWTREQMAQPNVQGRGLAKARGGRRKTGTK